MGCENLISVFTTKNPGEAEVVRLALEESGILAAIQGGVQAGLTGALDIDVMVRADDIVRAREFIAEHQAFPVSDEEVLRAELDSEKLDSEKNAGGERQDQTR